MTASMAATTPITTFSTRRARRVRRSLSVRVGSMRSMVGSFSFFVVSINSEALLQVGAQRVGEPGVVGLLVFAAAGMLGLELGYAVHGLLVGQQALHEAYACYHGLVAAQAQEQVVAHECEQQSEQAEPEDAAPVAPLEGVVLNVLGREELVGVQGVHLEG